MSTAKNTLDTEIDAFIESLPAMLQEHEGEWAVFKGKKCVGFRHCEQDIFNLAYSKYRDFVQMKECEVNRDELRWFGEYLDVYEQNAEKMLDLDVLGKEIE